MWRQLERRPALQMVASGCTGEENRLCGGASRRGEIRPPMRDAFENLGKTEPEEAERAEDDGAPRTANERAVALARASADGDSRASAPSIAITEARQHVGGGSRLSGQECKDQHG